jgi:hypothetical protein
VTHSDPLIEALRDLPAPEPRPEFVDRALRNATRTSVLGAHRRGRWGHLVTSWEAWIGAALGGAVAAALVLLFASPLPREHAEPAIELALHESRAIDVLIDSDRELKNATIRVAVTGGVALDGLTNEHIVDWRADLERGTNLLSLPVVALKPGQGQLVAVIEHEGRTRTVMINLSVSNSGVKRS